LDKFEHLPESARAELKLMFEALSDADRSTLFASLAEPGSQIGTSSASDNYTFLSKLSEFGLAEEISLGIDLPGASDMKLTSFRLSEDASAFIRSLIDSL